jgi:hypothetical protein
MKVVEKEKEAALTDRICYRATIRTSNAPPKQPALHGFA